ncbi:MAG: putative integral rane protein [Gaiellaceae bacterium]|nr:putative integral rane protein [Gaiellaceae bacterium]
MSFDDWILALHVLSAFAYVAAIVLFWVLIAAVRRADTPDETIRMEPIVKVGNGAVAVGVGGTLIFGLWLAFSVGGYDIWDPWIIIALVLWAVAGGIGQRTGVEFTAGMTRAKELEAAGQNGPSAELLAVNRTQRGLWLHTAASVVLLLILIDMIWKPGA